jgi:hypothetical protein
VRGFQFGFVGLLTVTMALACAGPGSTPAEAPAAPPAEEALAEAAPVEKTAEAASTEEAEEAGPEAEATSGKPKPGSGLACKSGLLNSYRELLSNGCSLNTKSKGMPLAMTYRVLRNAPFAARGRKFKSPELTAFFKSEDFCSGGDTYKPEHDTVIIEPGSELDCIAKLRAREDELRQSKQPTPSMEVFILSNPQGGLQTEAKRIAGQDVLGSNATFFYGETNWTVNFYSEWMEEDFKAESSVIVVCDEKGNNCRHEFAG